MNQPKDVVDYLKEKRQLEEQLKYLHSKKHLLPTEEVIIEEAERRLGIVINLIDKLS